jgi:hypothetical protein
MPKKKKRVGASDEAPQRPPYQPPYLGEASPDVGLLVSLLPYLRTNPEYFETLRGSLEAQGQHEHVRQLDRLSTAALRRFGGSHFTADTAEQLRRHLRPSVEGVLGLSFGHGVGDVLRLSFAQAADLLEREPQTPGTGQPGRPAGRKLSATERRILTLCRRKAIKGERLASHHLQLSYGYVRGLLGRLTKEGRLRNDPESGYRTVSG